VSSQQSSAGIHLISPILGPGPLAWTEAPYVIVIILMIACIFGIVPPQPWKCRWKLLQARHMMFYISIAYPKFQKYPRSWRKITETQPIAGINIAGNNE
jgi:hypothetical protein